MIYLPKEDSCTGCSTCRDVCPKEAIAMTYDAAGFRYPVINHDKCIECHLCEKRCPALSEDNIDNPYVKTFAGYTSDHKLLMSTTSGGFASKLSEIFIGDGGKVAGVRYNSDCFHAEYSLALNMQGIEEFRGSKYVQSEKNGIFLLIRTALENGEKVLFIGCPCDVAGLLSVLKNTPKDRLLTCELVCMGVTSPKIGEEYGKYIYNKYHSRVNNICARSKDKGWFVPNLKIQLESGKKIIEPLYASYFGRGFQIYNRPSCFNCRYRGTNGLADLRIGDFWGIKKQDKYWNKDGVSCIFARTSKGLDAIESMKNNGFKFFEVEYTTATENNMSSTKNKGEKYEALYRHFRDVFMSKGLVAACNATSDFGFRMKRIIPASLQPVVKHIYHLLRDK